MPKKPESDEPKENSKPIIKPICTPCFNGLHHRHNSEINGDITPLYSCILGVHRLAEAGEKCTCQWHGHWGSSGHPEVGP